MNIITHLRALGRRRIMRQRLQQQLVELRQRKAMLEADLDKMRHWSPAVQQSMREQIDAVQQRIVSVERSIEV